MSTAQTPLTLRRWRRAEYDRLVELGVFRGEPIELIAGHLVVAEPQGAYHASALTRVDYALRAVLPPGWIVRVQAPISLDDDSEPEPDLAAVRGHPGDYEESHPTARVLEVYRDPQPDASAIHGWRYATATVLTPAAVVDPPAFPSVEIPVASLLPPGVLP